MDREIGYKEIPTLENTKNLCNSLHHLPLGKIQSYNKFTWYRRNYSALFRAQTLVTQPVVLHLATFSPTISLLWQGDVATIPLLRQINLIQIRTQYLFNIYLLSFLLSLDIRCYIFTILLKVFKHLKPVFFVLPSLSFLGLNIILPSRHVSLNLTFHSRFRLKICNHFINALCVLHPIYSLKVLIWPSYIT
jgi:hypothetical protein